MDKRCNCCGVHFDPSTQGVVGGINGQEVAICGPCCSGDYVEDRPAVIVRYPINQGEV